MSEKLTEQQVLDALDIPDFRHLTKNKVMLLASMLDRLDPEVAKKALEQFPEFASMGKELVAEYKESLNQALEQNQQSVKTYYDACSKILSTLEKQLERDDLSFEERKYFLEKMDEVAEKMGQKDTENKNFLFGVLKFLAGITGVAFLAAAAVLGANLKSGNDTSA